MPPKKKDDKKGQEQEEEAKGEVGIYYFSDGSKYDGQFTKKNQGEGIPPLVKRHGLGVYTDGGTMYDGAWVDDAMHGDGVMTFDTAAVYTGTFFQNVFCGRGVYKWPDSSSYEGQWRHNKMHGEGVYIDSSGRRWTGKFYDNIGVDLVQEVL